MASTGTARYSACEPSRRKPRSPPVPKTGRPIHSDGPCSTTPAKSRPGVRGTVVSSILPRTFFTSLGLIAAAWTLTRTSPARGTGRSIVSTPRFSSEPVRAKRSALMLIAPSLRDLRTLPENLPVRAVPRPQRKLVVVEPVLPLQRVGEAPRMELAFQEVADQLVLRVHLVATEVGQVVRPAAGRSLGVLGPLPPCDLHGHDTRLGIDEVSDGILTEGVVRRAARPVLDRVDQPPLPDDRLAWIVRHAALLWDGGLRHRRDARPQLEVVVQAVVVAVVLELANHVAAGREDDIGAHRLVAVHEDLRDQRLVAGLRDDEVDVCGPVRMPAGEPQQIADRPVGRHRVGRRHQRHEVVCPRLVGLELAPEIVVGLGLVLVLVEAVRG